MRVSYTTEEIINIRKKFSEMGAGAPPLENIKTKKAINNIYFDKYSRLWVISSIKRDKTNSGDFYVDIFKSGIFLKTVKLDIVKGNDFIDFDEQIYLKNDRIFVLNSTKATIKVYEY